MFLEICMQIHSVVFAINPQINKQKVRENNLRAGNKVFVKNQAKGGWLTPIPPLRTPLLSLVSKCTSRIDQLVEGKQKQISH